MNKLKAILFTLVTVTTLTFFLTSCEEDYPSLPDDNILFNKELSANEIGRYHNIAVDLFQKSAANKKGKKLNIMEIQNSVTELMKENYPELMADFTLPKEKNFLKRKYIMKTEDDVDFDFNSFVIDGLNNSVDTDLISEIFANKIIAISTDEDLSFEKIMDKIKSMRSYNLGANERNILDVYESTLQASNEYWTAFDKSEKVNRIKCSSKVIAGDAAGAALGLVGSPLWSIIQGAVVSIAINEDCNEK